MPTVHCGDALNSIAKMIEDIHLKHNLSLLNSGLTRCQEPNSCSSQTCLHPASGSTSPIDLYICMPGLYRDMEWRVHKDLCGSDHYPLIIHFQGNDHTEASSSWKLAKADWASFAELASSKLSSDNNSIDDFCSALLSILPSVHPAPREHEHLAYLLSKRCEFLKNGADVYMVNSDWR